MAWLQHGSERRLLQLGELVIGSGERSDWRLVDGDLAPRHLVVILDDTGVVSIRAISVDQVTSVNGEQLGASPRAARHGDVIRAGRATLIYLDREDVGADANAFATPLGTDAEVWLVDDRRALAYQVSTDTTGIGRDASNAVPLTDATVSRFHANLRREAGGVVLHPTGSSGTRLNGHELSAPTLLTEGDAIEIAGTVLRVTRGPLPHGVRRPEPVPVADESSRRPTLEDSEAVPADVRRFQWQLSRTQLALLVILLALLFFIFFPTHG